MNELIDKLLERGDDLSNEAAEALKELADIKLVGGMVKAPRWLVMETRASRQSPRQSEMRSALRYSSSECRSRSISRTSVYRRITMTGTIVVKTLWFLEKVENSVPELLCAWDQYSIDENPQGYEEDMKKAHGSRGDAGDYRYIELKVDNSKIMSTFSPAKIKADVGLKLKRVGEDHRDALDQLSEALYDREVKASDYLGGSDAKILKDATEMIVELRKKPH